MTCPFKLGGIGKVTSGQKNLVKCGEAEHLVKPKHSGKESLMPLTILIDGTIVVFLLII